MIQIKKNEYTQPTEVREFMVQGIIDAFLSGGYYSIFHPFGQSAYRSATLYLFKKPWFESPYFLARYSDIGIGKEQYFLGKIRGCEMKEAFRIIQEAGYYIFKVYEYGSWMGYKVSDKPFVSDYKGATRVTEFNDFID